MTASTTTQDGARNDRFPPQIRYIVGNEACERFSYYGMRSLLALYITTVLGKPGDQATQIIHNFIFAVYFMPLLGAWLSDRIWGRYRTILWISLLYCVGHGVLAMSDLMDGVEARTRCLYLGLALIAFGSGGIKPCISAFVGDQFRPEQSHLLQKAYGAFYWSVNFGSFFSTLLVPWIKERAGYGWAFGVPGILMALSTLIFWLGTRYYVQVPPARATQGAGFFRILMHALRHQSERRPGQGFWDVARGRFKDEEVDGAAAVGPILGVFALIPPFWALFDQHASTWVLQGARMEPIRWGGLTVSAEQMQSANPAIVMVLVPLFTLGIYPRIGAWARPLRRIGAGLFLTAGSYVVVAWIQGRLDAGERLSLAWQVVPYLILTAGEVLVSTTGLEFAFTEAGKQMKSTIMSFWLLTIATGNLLVSWITHASAGNGAGGAVTAGRFLFYAELTFGVALAFVVVAMLYRYRNPANLAGAPAAR